MKKLLTIILAFTLTLSCLAGCSNKENSSTNNDAPLLDENEFSYSANSDAEISLNEGEFDPLSIVKDEYIVYSGNYNGDGRVEISFPENFEVEIIPDLYLTTPSGGKWLNVIYNNQSLGRLEYYFVGETLRYNDINKLSEGDVIELLARESEKSDSLSDNLAANGFTMVKIPMYITVPDLGELFSVKDTLNKEDIEYIISVADPSVGVPLQGCTYSENPISIYIGKIKSQATVGDAIKLKLVYERTTPSGIRALFVLTTCDLAKHDNSPATCSYKYEDKYGYKVDITDEELISNWSKDYIWEKLDY